MIQINTVDITDLVMPVEGTEESSLLELDLKKDGTEPAGEIVYSLTASMAGNDLLVSGKVSVPMKAVCAVCLDEFNYPLECKEVCHLYPDVLGKMVDITDDIREDLLIGLPIVFKCSPKCKGLCPGCGANLNREKCACKSGKKSRKTTEKPDKESPWGALDQLKF